VCSCERLRERGHVKLAEEQIATRKEERLTTDANTGRPAQSELGIL